MKKNLSFNFGKPVSFILALDGIVKEGSKYVRYSLKPGCSTIEIGNMHLVNIMQRCKNLKLNDLKNFHLFIVK